MSEASDDAQLAAKGEAPPAAGLDAEGDHDDVEVVAQADEPAPPQHDSVNPASSHESVNPRHDSVNPGSRRLAPPPKPKRDSSHPASIPPPPEQPLISYQDASGVVKPGTGLAEELNQEAGAFAAREAPSGTKPMAPRPRSRMPSVADAPVSVAPETRPSEGVMLPGPPPMSRDKLPTMPDEPLRSTPSSPPKSGGIFAQRIIAVGTPSRPPPVSAAFEPTLSQPAAPLPPPAPPAPVMEVPPPPRASMPDLTRTLDSAPELQPAVSQPAGSKPVVSAVRSAAPPPPPPPPPVELSPNGPATPPPGAFSLEEAPPRIPSAAELEDEEPTAPNASVEPFMAPAPVLTAPLIPAEPTPPPPMAEPPRAAAEAEALAPDEVGPDSADRMPVEELSREDSPSLPPDEPAAVAPPPAPSARAEVKLPPPPPKRAPAPAAAPVSVEGEKKKEKAEKAKQKRAWWEELFSEDFVRANWKVSEAQIKKEVTFVEESLGVAPGGVVLDLGCGAGQHSVELASRGYGVVGYDLSLYQLALAADNAQERSQKLNFLQGDMREMAFEEMFDGIFSWNTSFGYFEEEKNYSVAERTFRALRPGGMFLIDVMNRDFVAAHTPSSVWFEGDACVCMDDASIDYFTSRLRVKRSVILDDGRTRECTYSVRLYSFHELGKLLHDVGFRVTEVSGHPSTPGVFLGQASPRILMLAQRP